MIRFRYF